MMTLCWALAASLMLTACFTGVESTKAITKKDVKRALEGTEEAVDAERGKMYSVAKASFAEWQPGKLFYVTDDNVKLLFAPNAASATASLQQHYLSYKGYSTDTSIDGKDCVVIAFADEAGNEYLLPTNKTLEELSQPQLPYSIPFLIDIDEILQLRSMLVGKAVYVKSPLWYDAQGNLITGRKFVKVEMCFRATRCSPTRCALPIAKERHICLFRRHSHRCRTALIPTFSATVMCIFAIPKSATRTGRALSEAMWHLA